MTSELPDLGATAARVLWSYLQDEGFVQTAAERTRVEYAKGDIVVQLSYYAEEAPPRGVDVGLGFRYPDGSTDTVGLWALSSGGDSSTFESDRFSDEEELEDLLTRLRDGALRDYGEPYWTSPERLVVVVQRAAADREEQHRRSVDRKQLDAARRAFDEDDFQTAIERYVMVEGRLSPADEQRLKIARRKPSAGN